MIWTIIFFLSGAFDGFLLAEAGILASETWLYWAIVLNNAVSEFSLAAIAVRAYKRGAMKGRKDV